jgi:hypothetical protein
MVVKPLAGLVALLGAVAALLLVASPASARPAWLLPVDLLSTGEDSVGQPQVAIDPAGNEIAIWQRATGRFDAVVESASRPLGGSWSGPTRLSASDGEIFAPQLAVDSAGNALAIWFSFTGGFIESAHRPAGGSWSAPIRLSAGGANTDARLAIDRNGNALAIWQRFNGTESIVESAFRPLGGGWSGPVELSAAPDIAERPQIAFDPSGNAVAIWDRIDRPTSRFIETASRPLGGGWSEPSKLSAAGTEAVDPHIGVDSAGNALAIWQRVDRGDSVIESASRPLGGDWSRPTPVSPSGFNSQLAVDPAGNAVAIWQRFNGTESIIESASRPVGGDWSGPALLSATAFSSLGNNGSQPQVAIYPNGTAVAVWDRLNGGPDSRVVESASRLLGGSWSVPVALSAASGLAFESQVSLDRSGDAVAIWGRAEPSHAIQTAVLDGSAPKLQGLVAPTAGRARTQLRFAGSALDSWSPLGAVSWSFGDRGGASGLTATHVYAKPGRYPLALQVADAPGNATSATAAIAIAANVKVAHLAKTRKGKALLSLRCPKPADLPCTGLARLSVKKGKRKLGLGHRPFKVPGAKRRTLAIKLTAKAKRLLATAGPKGLKVSLSGDGLSSQTLRLR